MLEFLTANLFCFYVNNVNRILLFDFEICCHKYVYVCDNVLCDKNISSPQPNIRIVPTRKLFV